MEGTSRRLSTMVPLEVFQELTRFAKEEASTGLGHFDYGIAIKLLLERSEVYKRLNNIETKLKEIEKNG